ncbi:metalloregulator ArsR/SmtB family transcription factor [Bacillus toyonensis]|uniref:ArsR/SmtB family transcription factor n=1 Tax=Bacillus toyonensis TaxID=155322 RepID=UPI002E1FC3DB|nr:metalloregulator ArsR/SmtB family transcription factor [Bacillus toyonensis]
MTELMKNRAEALKVIAHPDRLKIVKFLSERGTQNVTSIQSVLNLPQSTVSQHLGKLKRSDLVKADRKGLEMYYSIEREYIEQVITGIL